MDWIKINYNSRLTILEWEKWNLISCNERLFSEGLIEQCEKIYSEILFNDQKIKELKKQNEQYNLFLSGFVCPPVSEQFSKKCIKVLQKANKK
jgi:hypothetical protein